MLLAGLTVLVVDDDAESLEVLGAHLLQEGARALGARSGAAALEIAEETPPDALIGELNLIDLDGRALLSALRALPAKKSLPAVALTAQPALVGYTRALGAGFEKYLIKPARFADVTDALCCVTGKRRAASAHLEPTTQEIDDSLAVHDYRTLLGRMNSTTAHRHTALFRFDDAELTSVWTFDRERPELDPFPLRLRIAETPCALLRASRAPIALEDTGRDDRTAGTRRAHGMRSLSGVAIPSDGPVPFGALCHFDAEPRPCSARSLELLEQVARMLRSRSTKPSRPPP
jgi:DNA-binding response OmpR family regulator